jgi:tRNA G18 (ribose-2'-O)-methylase SpoU
MPEPDVPVKRERALAETERMVKRLGDELDEMIKMFSWGRECLKNELTEGMGYKKMALSDKDLKKMKELAEMMNTVVSAKIRFDKASKAMADTMSPAEEQSAVVAYLKSVDPDIRAQIIHHVKQWQDAKYASRTTDD